MLAENNERLRYIIPEERKLCARVQLAYIADEFSFEYSQLHVYGNRGDNFIPSFNRYLQAGKDIGERTVELHSNGTVEDELVYDFESDNGGFEIYKTKNGINYKLFFKGVLYDFNFTVGHLYFCHEKYLFDFNVYRLTTMRISFNKITSSEMDSQYLLRFTSLDVPEEFLQNIIMESSNSASSISKESNLTRRLHNEEDEVSLPPSAPITKELPISVQTNSKQTENPVKMPIIRSNLLSNSELPKFKKLDLRKIPDDCINSNGHIVSRSTLGFIVLAAASFILARIAEHEDELLNYE